MKKQNPVAQLLPLFFIIFIDTIGYFLIIPVLLRLFFGADAGLISVDTTLHQRDFLYAVAMTISPLAFLLFSPVAGHLSDRYGRKTLLFACLIASLTGFLLPILGIVKKSIGLIFVGRFITGASTCGQPVAQAAITDFAEGKQKAFFLSLIAFAMTLGMVLGPVFGGYLSDANLVSWFTTTTPFWFGLCLALINITLLMIFFTESRIVMNVHRTTSFKKYLSNLIEAIQFNRIYQLMIVFFFMEIAWSLYYQSIFLILNQRFHYSTEQISLFTGYIGFWMSLGLTIIYKITIKYISIERFLLISLIIATAGFTGCIITSSVLAQWIFVIPTSICIGTAYPSLIALMSNRAEKDNQGYVIGFASTIMGLTWMITGFLSGTLLEISSLIPLLLAAASCFFALLLQLRS